MSLQTRRPPGHAKRKALTYATEILSLRALGHSYSAIREALEDAGVMVSISTVRREVLRGGTAPATFKPAVAASRPRVGSFNRAEASRLCSAADPAPGSPSLPGRAIAEEFMRNRSTNTLFLKESSK
jgi:hypothetical protein